MFFWARIVPKILSFDSSAKCLRHAGLTSSYFVYDHDIECALQAVELFLDCSEKFEIRIFEFSIVASRGSLVTYVVSLRFAAQFPYRCLDFEFTIMDMLVLVFI